MTDIPAGFLAGLVATALLSLLMLAKRALKIMPELGLIGMLARVSDQPRPVDWVMHFIVGTFFYGILIALVVPANGGAYWADGIVAGLIGWVFAGLTLMPTAGKGYFGLSVGGAAVAVSLVMHLIFGILLGLLYGWFLPI